MWLISFLLGTIAATTTAKEVVLIMKCCPEHEQLDSRFRSCQTLSHPNTVFTNASVPNTTVLGEIDEAEAEVEVEARGTQLTAKSVWLPEEFSFGPEQEVTALFGRRPNCTDRRTLRLALPRNGHRAQLLRNGSMTLHSPTARGALQLLLYTPEDFCVDAYEDESGAWRHALLVCACHRVQCVSKCCATGKAKFCDGDDCSCEDHPGDWKPFHPDLPPPEADFTYEVLQDNDGVCPEGFDPWIANPWIYPLHFTRGYWEYPDGDLFSNINMCGDAIVREGELPRQGVMRCYRSPPFWEIVELGLALHVPESVLLALAIATILVVPRRRVSPYSYVHDHAMCCHAASLLACSLTWTFYIGASSTICLHTPVVIYFSLVSASLWLNVICINMACGFWKPLGLQHGRFGGARGMFLCYSLYAWGTAGAMTAFTAYMWYSTDVPARLIRPTLHETRTCFREEDGGGKMATFAYYYGPMAALLLVNGLLFSSTAFRVRQLRRHSGILDNKVSTGREASLHTRRSVMVYIKLLWLVGVTEMSVDVAAWASNSNEYYFALGSSCIDVLRAAAIFVLCCCKRRTLRALHDRLRACAPVHLLRRWRARRSVEEVDLPRVDDHSSKSASTTSFGTEVTLCASDSSSKTD